MMAAGVVLEGCAHTFVVQRRRVGRTAAKTATANGHVREKKIWTEKLENFEIHVVVAEKSGGGDEG